MNGPGVFLIKLLIHTKSNIFVISRKGGKNMFFTDYRARKYEEKKRRDYMAMVYPPGYSTAPKRQPNTNYKLQTTKEELVQCLITYDHMKKEDAEQQAADMLELLPQSLKENLDEAVQRKPLSNILINDYKTLAEAVEFFYNINAIRSMYYAIYYLSAELTEVFPTPDEWIAEYKKALVEG